MTEPRTTRIHGRSAFTLIEVLLALTLATALVAAALSAFEMYRQLSVSGRRDLERSQLLRALADRIGDDIRSVAFTPVEEETSESDETDSEDGAADETTTEETEITVTDPADALAGGNLGLVGNETTLVLHTNRPSRSALSGDLTTAIASRDVRMSDLLSVSYFLAYSGAEGLPGIVADRFAGTTPERETNEPIGLVRMEGDRLVMTLADANADQETLAQGAELMAPEVIALRFRYFDGTEWYTEWDATAYNRLPRAVEIALAIEVEFDRVTMDEDAEPVPMEYRHVVWLPSADPTPVEEVLQ